MRNSIHILLLLLMLAGCRTTTTTGSTTSATSETHKEKTVDIDREFASDTTLIYVYESPDTFIRTEYRDRWKWKDRYIRDTVFIQKTDTLVTTLTEIVEKKPSPVPAIIAIIAFLSMIAVVIIFAKRTP